VADLADVEVALSGVVTTAEYPAGTAAPNVTGNPIYVFRGWPSTSQLRRDRSDGAIDISVTAVPNSARNTTRWGVQVTELPVPATLTVGTSGNSATFFGTASGGDPAGVLVAQKSYVYSAQDGDSAALAAAALAALIRVDRICWLTQATLTVPGVSSLVARAVGQVNAVEEWARQEQEFRISIWAPSPGIRDATASVVMQALTSIAFLALGDGTGARLRFHGVTNLDDDQTASMYRRDIIYSVEYGTTVVSSNPSMLFGDLAWNGATIVA
jgi:hypothetical protein